MRNVEPLRFSRLKLMGKSPAHYAAYVPEPTGAMETGTAADRLLLGGEVLSYPGQVRRGKDYDAFCERNPGALIVTQKEGAIAYGIAESVTKCADAMRLLTGVRQETIYWDFNGRPCRGTPDVRGDGFLCDLKTGETSDPRFFPFKVRRYAYHAQMSFYETGVMLAKLPPVTQSYIVAVEQAPPHVVTVYRLTDNTIELGARLWRLWIEQLQVCEASGAFPAYSQSIVDLELFEDEGLDLGDAVEVVETTA
jgi:exodeoxyribonuclease VIII